jgi:hypothetical protein
MKTSLTIGLWNKQQRFITDYLTAKDTYGFVPIPNLTLSERLWLWGARAYPCNIKIRQLVIRDLISGNPNNARRIYRQMMLLSIGGTGVWQESYEYWHVDTCQFLDVWLDKFKEYECAVWGAWVSVNMEIKQLRDKIQDNFSRTCYTDGKPVPIGDQPDKAYPELKEGALTDVPIGNITMRWGHKNNGNFEYTYLIDACPVGFNTHCCTKFYSVTVCNGVVKGFTWYDCSAGKGDSLKYPTAWSKILDILQPARVWSAINLLLRGIYENIQRHG